MKAKLLDGSLRMFEDQPFARGADGAVHRSPDGTSVLKLYFKPEPWRKASLEAIIGNFNALRDVKAAHTDPYWQELFCWPTEIVVSPRLGVIMPHAPAGVAKLARFILPRWLFYHPEDIGNWQARLTVAIKLARALKRLHFKGLCHSDISENNLLANPHDGRLVVLDCDGLVVPGLNIARPVVVGTPGYMAPELVMDPRTSPSTLTDLHAFAVMIYELLLLRHPLNGRKVFANDPIEDDRLRHGAQALYIEHPTDQSNRPQRLAWPSALLGPRVNRLLHQAFVDGLHKPSLRPLAAQWEQELVRLADLLLVCANDACLFKAYPLPQPYRPGMPVACPWCGTRLRGCSLPLLRWSNPEPGKPGVYRTDGTAKLGFDNDGLQQWHVRPNALPGPRTDATVLASFHSQRNGSGDVRWYLVNLALPLLEAADPGGAWKRIHANQGVELKAGRRLRFGPPGTARDAEVVMAEFQ